MPARQFEERWLLVDVDEGEVVVSFRVVGVKLNGLAERLFGGAALAFEAERDAKVVLGMRVVRIQLSGPAQDIESLVISGLLIAEKTQQGEGLGIVWFLRGHLVQRRFRSLQLPLLQMRRRKIGQKIHILLVQNKRLPEFLLGFGKLTALEGAPGVGDQCRGTGRNLSSGAFGRGELGPIAQSGLGVEEGQLLGCEGDLTRFIHLDARAQDGEFLREPVLLRASTAHFAILHLARECGHPLA